jgi:hypothetical protein
MGGWARINMASLSTEQGRIDEAAAQFRKALEVGGDATPAREILSALEK